MSTITVYANGVLLVEGKDYIFEPKTKTLRFQSSNASRSTGEFSDLERLLCAKTVEFSSCTQSKEDKRPYYRKHSKSKWDDLEETY